MHFLPFRNVPVLWYLALSHCPRHPLSADQSIPISICPLHEHTVILPRAPRQLRQDLDGPAGGGLAVRHAHAGLPGQVRGLHLHSAMLPGGTRGRSAQRSSGRGGGRGGGSTGRRRASSCSALRTADGGHAGWRTEDMAGGGRRTGRIEGGGHGGLRAAAMSSARCIAGRRVGKVQALPSMAWWRGATSRGQLPW